MLGVPAMRSRPLALSDSQLDTVSRAAGLLPAEKRDLYLQRVAAALNLQRRFGDAEVEAAVRAALQGLVQVPAA
jgi:hypothetical protein